MGVFIGKDCCNIIKNYLEEHSLTTHLRNNQKFLIIWVKALNCYFRRQIVISATNGACEICFSQWRIDLERVDRHEMLFNSNKATQTDWSNLDDIFFEYFGKVPSVPTRKYLDNDLGIYGSVRVV